MAAWASVADGLADWRTDEKKRSNPLLPSVVVSQCQAVRSAGTVSRKALCWLSKTSSTSLASSSGSFRRPRTREPSW